MIRFIFDMAKRFRRDEKGIALTEYLVLLGLLVAGVIAAVILFGEALTDVWTGWANWLDSDAVQAPDPVVASGG